MALPAEMPADLHKAITFFCEKDPEDLQLNDVLGVTEIMALCLRDLFATEDTPIFSSAVMMAAYVRGARERLKNVRPASLRDEDLPLAREELEAIVAHTEEATNTIMELAETMMGLDPEESNYSETINDSLMQIFEACAFQDITGQRAGKVADTIATTSEQISVVASVLGSAHDKTVGPAEETEEEARRRENLLHGPQSGSQAITQDEVDEMINQDDIDSLFD